MSKSPGRRWKGPRAAVSVDWPRSDANRHRVPPVSEPLGTKPTPCPPGRRSPKRHRPLASGASVRSGRFCLSQRRLMARRPSLACRGPVATARGMLANASRSSGRRSSPDIVRLSGSCGRAATERRNVPGPQRRARLRMTRRSEARHKRCRYPCGATRRAACGPAPKARPSAARSCCRADTACPRGSPATADRAPRPCGSR